MRKRGKWWAALLLVMGLAVVIRVAMRPPSEITLPSGTQVRYLGAVRADQPFTTERWIDRMGRKFLPTSLQGWIPSPWVAPTFPGLSNSLAVILSVTLPTATLKQEHLWEAFSPEDAQGFRFPASFNTFKQGHLATYHCSLIFSVFPRREHRFLLHLLDDKGEIIGTIVVRNPMAPSIQNWSPEPLPIRQTNGPVVLTLGAATQRQPGRSRFLDPQWSVFSEDPKWTNSLVRPTTLRDSTGNETWAVDGWMFPSQADPQPPLSPAEPAWKLSFSVHRTRIIDFAESERLVLTNLAWPGEGSFTPIRASMPTSGVELVGLLGGSGDIKIADVKAEIPDKYFDPRTRFDGDLDRHISHPTRFLRIDAEGVDSPHDLIVNVRDNANGLTTITNEHLVFWDRTRVGAGRGISFEGPIVTPEGTSPVSLEIAANGSLKFEFVIAPQKISPSTKTTR